MLVRPRRTDQKNETLDAASNRLTLAELGMQLDRRQADFYGIFEHFYPDYFAGDGIGTHYIVLAHELRLDKLDPLPADQHSTYRWLFPDELLIDPLVHENVKAYFR